MTMEFLRKYTCYIYILLWMLYNLQGVLMLKGLVAQIIFMALLGLSFYACYQVNTHYKISPYIKWLNVMLVILTVYGVYLIVDGEVVYKGKFLDKVVSSHSYLQAIYISVMPIYAFYYFSLKRELNPHNMKVVFLLLFAFSVAAYYQQYFKVSANSGKEDVVNNIGFLFVPLIPMLAIVKMRNIWKYILVLLSFGFIMLSMKRGAILTGGVVLLLFMMHNVKVRTKTQIVSTFGLLITVTFVIYKLVANLYTTNAFFHRRFELTMQGYTSQREKLYSYFWHTFSEGTSPFEFFFGHGANGTVALYGQYAHNDWLEFAINQGLLGVILYVVYWIIFIKEWLDCETDDIRQALGSIIVAYLMISFFSMSYGCMPLAASLCIGYCLAMNMRIRLVNFLKKELE